MVVSNTIGTDIDYIVKRQAASLQKDVSSDRGLKAYKTFFGRLKTTAVLFSRKCIARLRASV